MEVLTVSTRHTAVRVKVGFGASNTFVLSFRMHYSPWTVQRIFFGYFRLVFT